MRKSERKGLRRERAMSVLVLVGNDIPDIPAGLCNVVLSGCVSLLSGFHVDTRRPEDRRRRFREGVNKDWERANVVARRLRQHDGEAGRMQAGVRRKRKTLPPKHEPVFHLNLTGRVRS